MRRTLAALALVLAGAFGCGSDDDAPTRTGETTPEGEHCTAELPDGSCLTEEEGERGADRIAEYTRCIRETPDEDEAAECPLPGEMP
jgi:hypothetical protein